ncbi:MAG: hypothetical protein ABIG44_06665 [Planctomycetota bacterium]
MSDQQPYARYTPPPGRESIILSLVSAGLFLYVGFMLGLEGRSDSIVYNASVSALVWGARVVGIGLLITTFMTFVRAPGADALDFFMATLAAGGCLVIGAIWIAYSDMQGILLLLFGALNLSAARAAWAQWQYQRAQARLEDEPFEHE